MENNNRWDRAYEIKAVGLLAIGFGLVGLDRFIILPLFPVIAEDLGLSYQDMGLIAGILALTWGVAAVVTGKLSDHVGYKRVLVATTILFSLLVASSGLATGLLSLLLIRGLMGFAEGGFVPASIVATVRASRPDRVGAMVGIQQMAAPLVGLFLGPIDRHRPASGFAKLGMGVSRWSRCLASWSPIFWPARSGRRPPGGRVLRRRRRSRRRRPGLRSMRCSNTAMSSMAGWGWLGFLPACIPCRRHAKLLDRSSGFVA